MLLLACCVLGVPTPALFEDPAPATALVISGANNHWWEWTTPSLVSILEHSGKFEVRVTTEPARTLADEAALSDVDVFVLDYNGPRWGAEAERGFVEAVRRGAGVSVIHAANNAFPGWSEYERMVGLTWRDGAGHGAFHPFDIEVSLREHPITRDLPRMVAHPDELYHGLTATPGSEHVVLLHAYSDPANGGVGSWQPLALVNHFGAGRVFHTALGHVWRDSEAQQASHRDPQFRSLVVRGTEWAATGRVTPARRAPNTLTELEQRAGWRLLFDGETLDGWHEYKRAAPPTDGWTVVDGALTIAAGSAVGDLVTDRSYQDFEFAFDWRVTPGANSGVMVRVAPEGDTTYLTGPEYQVLDDLHHDVGERPLQAAGALYDLYPATDKLLAPVGSWNTARIVLIGNRLEHWLNGRRIVACELASDDWNQRRAQSKFADFAGFGEQPSGLIALQNHGNEVAYRNLAIRDLSPRSERAQPLLGDALEGWTAVFEPGASDPGASTWRRDGDTLLCSGAPQGYLMSEASWVNCVLTLEWRWDPAAEGATRNSGVLLRAQPAEDGAWTVWPRCIEAQLMSGRAGDFVRIGDFPMQTAAAGTQGPARTQGIVARAAAAVERPIGEWNRYEILADRGDVVVRLNGVIVNQGASAAELPGALALQSEGAPLAFRALTIQPLP